MKSKSRRVGSRMGSAVAVHIEGLESRRMLSSNLVADYGGIYPTDAVTVNGISYFTADDGVHGRELWRSDGTAGGTQMVKDITPGAAATNIYSLNAVGDSLVCIVREADGDAFVWRSNGTEGGTTMLKEIALPGHFTNYLGTVANDRMIFQIERPRGPITGEELWDWQLWATDGTVAGTGSIQTVSGAQGEYYNYIQDIYSLGEHAVYMGIDGKTWSSDGTAAGTFVLRQAGLQKWDTVKLGDELIFSGSNGIWKTDGTLAGTSQFTDITGGHFAEFNGKLVFEHLDWDHGGRWLAITDGTAAGTRLLATSPGGPWQVSFGATLGNEFIVPIMASSPGGGEPATNYNELWKTDGTPEGTFRIAELPHENVSVFNSPFASAGGLTFFVYDEINGPKTLWRTDGTSDGTQLVDTVPDNAGGVQAIDGKLVVTTAFYQEQPSVLVAMDPATMLTPVGPSQGSISLKDGVLRIHGSMGNDLIRIYHHTSIADRFVVNLNGVKKSFLLSDVNKVHIYGYSGDDNISFYDGYGRVATRSRIWGGAGNDIVYTGLNRDTLYGDAGDDSLNSGHNDDILMGGDGDDLINAGIGNDTASGENGSDHVNGGIGSDMVSGGDDGSQDWVDGGVGADVLFGSAVFDTFFNPQQAGDPLDEILV